MSTMSHHVEELEVEPLFRTYHKLHYQQTALYHAIDKPYRYNGLMVNKIADIAVGSKRNPEAVLSLLRVTEGVLFNLHPHCNLYLVDKAAVEAMDSGNSPLSIQQQRLGILSVRKAGAALFPLDSLRKESGEPYFPDLKVEVGIEEGGGILIVDRTQNGTWIYADWEKAGRPYIDRPVWEAAAIPEGGATIRHLIPKQTNRLS